MGNCHCDIDYHCKSDYKNAGKEKGKKANCTADDAYTNARGAERGEE